MMAFNTLRIDAGDGSRIVDYRIENGHVENRAAEAAADGEIEQQWQQLTPEEISAHVMANTVVAHWLLRRMGLYQLMRACSPDYSPQGIVCTTRLRERALENDGDGLPAGTTFRVYSLLKLDGHRLK